MTSGEMAYVVMVIAAFCTFGIVLAVTSSWAKEKRQ